MVLTAVDYAAKNLTVRYGGRPALTDIDLTLPLGKISVLIGPNGSGKSTLLRCLTGALRPHAGGVYLDGEDVHRTAASRLARKVAYVPQENPTPFAFTVAELIGLATAHAPAAIHTTAAIDALDLGEHLNTSLTALSGGERQRAALARGLAQGTPYLLLDEPTAHLDLRHQLALFSLLKAKVEGGRAGVLVVLHDLNVAARWGDHVFLLEGGRMVADGIPETVLTAEWLEATYRVGLKIRRGETGNLFLEPTERASDI